MRRPFPYREFLKSSDEEALEILRDFYGEEIDGEDFSPYLTPMTHDGVAVKGAGDRFNELEKKGLIVCVDDDFIYGFPEDLEESNEEKKMEKNHLHLLAQDQIDWCNRHIVEEWWVNSKGEVEVNVSLSFRLRNEIEKFPVQFADVKGTFFCYECSNLTSLEGAPQYVGEDFKCGRCTNLTSLEGAPREVKGDFDCSSCTSLVSLEGAPVRVGGEFFCSKCASLDSFSAVLAEDEELLKKWLKSSPRLSPEKFLHDNRGAIHGKKFGI